LPIDGIQSVLLEAVCWDRDRFGKDFLGEFDVVVEDIFANGQTVQEVSYIVDQLRISLLTINSLAGLPWNQGGREKRERERYPEKSNCNSASWILQTRRHTPKKFFRNWHQRLA
jgi:hypothetical protein